MLNQVLDPLRSLPLTGLVALVPVILLPVVLAVPRVRRTRCFGAFQALVGKLLGFPALLLPTLNSVGADFYIAAPKVMTT